MPNVHQCDNNASDTSCARQNEALKGSNPGASAYWGCDGLSDAQEYKFERTSTVHRAIGGNRQGRFIPVGRYQTRQVLPALQPTQKSQWKNCTRADFLPGECFRPRRFGSIPSVL